MPVCGNEKMNATLEKVTPDRGSDVRQSALGRSRGCVALSRRTGDFRVPCYSASLSGRRSQCGAMDSFCHFKQLCPVFLRTTCVRTHVSLCQWLSTSAPRETLEHTVSDCLVGALISLPLDCDVRKCQGPAQR